MTRLYPYNKNSIRVNAGEITGVYYLWASNTTGKYVAYVGRATERMQARLLEHLHAGEWPDIVSFSYVVCSSELEAKRLEESEIKRLKPKYNKSGKASYRF